MDEGTREAAAAAAAAGPAIEVREAGPGSWGDVQSVLDGPGDPARCWCQWFMVRNADWEGSSPTDRRAALEGQVTAGGSLAPGLLATRDGEPVGWCRVGPRSGYPRLTASTKVRALGGGDLDDPAVWAVVCFVVTPGSRRTGVTALLLDAAVEFARANGARMVEAYPVDVSSRPRTGAAQLYHGALSTFLAAGFSEVGRTTQARPVVRLDL